MNEMNEFWWNSLRHEGLLLDQTRLGELQVLFESQSLPAKWLCEKLRLKLSQQNEISELVSLVLENICHFDQKFAVVKGTDVPSTWSCSIPGLRENIKPNWLFMENERVILPVFLEKADNRRLGQGRGSVFYSKILRWMRSLRQSLALLTNGRQWRLIYASLDNDAYCEWDSEIWFANGEPSPEFLGFLQIFSPDIWTRPNGALSRLQTAVQDSRKGQNDLSGQMGERVRLAVELLIREHGQALNELSESVDAKSIYMAGVRMVMRLVVVFFAESREGLLPKTNAIFSQNYSLGNLIQQLKRHRGSKEMLSSSYQAWPRLLALMKLIYTGSSHEAMPVAPYGGQLFAPGDSSSPDAISRVIALFENEYRNQNRPVMSDAAVLEMLVMLAETRVRIRQQRQFITVPMPIDFSSLGNEYIGILFESLLNFELKQAEEDNPIVFVNVGDQPALPLNKLEQMSDKELSDMFKALKEAAKKAAAGDASGDDDSSETTEEPEDSDEETTEESAGEPEADESEDEIDDIGAVRKRTLEWATRACRVTGIVRAPRTRNQTTLAQYEEALAREAKKLVPIIVEPGQWYLVRWGGTRKGSGTFYTKPQLAVPTVERTLSPLVHNADGGWRAPAEIESLRICDPACGSGSFLLASLRYLTSALYDSILASGNLENDALRNVQDMISGVPSGDALSSEQLPCRPDEDDFEPRFKALLRRHIVEHCIYGVDLDAVAVELCRLALWIETLDRTLPMTFLDHKIKCGNSLVGTWSDQFLHYPLAAWTREGGDKGHKNGVHFTDSAWTKEIADKLKVAKSQITLQLDNELGFTTFMSPNEVTGKMDVLRKSMAKLHAIKVVDVKEQAKLYSDLRASEEYRALKSSFDLWCALWFWPGEELDIAPLPENFALERLSPEQYTLLQKIANDNHFFHWELEFPEVFNANSFGFDAILGNPPWDTFQPMSMEFFSNIDPLYRSYGKQEALRKQVEYFEQSMQVEEDWLNYNTSFSNGAHWYTNVATPYEVSLGNAKTNQRYKEEWQKRRVTISGEEKKHGYIYQGKSKAYGQKLFLERAYFLAKDNGRIGFIVPSGIYSDNGTKELRELFFNQCRLEWLFSFENRKKIFDIHRSYKFNPLVIQKGGHTEQFKAAFMRQNIADWENAENIAFDYPVDQIKMFSPDSLSVLELNSARELEILTKIYNHSILLGSDDEHGWNLSIKQGDFNMTSDSHLFPPQDTWCEWGYEPDEYSRWVKGPWKPVDELYALPEVAPHVHSLAVVAQPPYNTLRVKRSDIPVGIILSRDCTKWLRYEEIPIVKFTEANGKVITKKIGTGKHAHFVEITGKAIALPLYEGKMLAHFDFSYQGFLAGTGNKTDWQEISWNHKHIAAHYLMGETVVKQLGGTCEKGAFRDIGCATNNRTIFRGSFRDMARSTDKRTIYCAAIGCLPCGNTAIVLGCNNKSSVYLLMPVINSFAFDFLLRLRMAGTHLSQFVMKPSPLITPKAAECLSQVAFRLSICDKLFLDSETLPNIHQHFAITIHERTRLKAIAEAIVSVLYGLSEVDMKQIFKDCDWSVADINSKSSTFNPKGFWRVDREVEPEQRQTVLSLVAFMDLERVIEAKGGNVQAGIQEFLAQNGGDGWMLPETLRLADYGLGHDERAEESQPVASVLGPRFYDWQQAQSTEDFQKECEVHAANLALSVGSQPPIDDVPPENDTEQPTKKKKASSASNGSLNQMTFDF